ncbi:Clp protease N-terminal domain-containing protein [Actinotalea sp. K2]|uniref:Clp protease N-terminal domain-containing protein n=1 Tax=Actinotalea sp. K2 TaxID=2939438 RepID=UPI0020179A82|nr:Clp protease N-terminal domain-containing protein [Actinotalea sp. K2]
MYDESFVAVMTATTNEATALGAHAYGSEHVLLGLLASDDELTQKVVRAFPGLTTASVRDAVLGAVDDAPHLARLGLTAHDPAVTVPAEREGSGTRPRTKHTPELQAALNRATVKWGHLRRTRAVPNEGKVSSAVLWLGVLEPSARVPRLLDAMGIDPDDVRTAVLSALVPPGAAVPMWPAEVPAGPITRLLHRVLGRTIVDG